MNRKTCLKLVAHLGVALVAVALMAAPSFAVDYYLAAKQFNMPMPDGTSVPMWGYVADPDLEGDVDGDGLVEGDCFEAATAAARLACVNALPAPTVPGPRLTVAPAEPANQLRIFLTNGLPAPTSIVIPGQEMPFSAQNATTGLPENGPTWTDGSFGPRPSPTARVRSFGREAAANGGRRQYIWNNFRGTPFEPGTYLYQSGTRPQVQVQMGLYGAVTRDAAAGQAYSSVPYVAQRDLFFSEVDPALHQAVADDKYGANCGNPPCTKTSTLDYNPKYFLLQRYDATTGLPVDATIGPTLPNTCISGTDLAAGNRILLRMYNAGLRQLAPMMLGSHFDLVAEGGKKYQFARQQYQMLLMPGSTQDAIFTPGYDGNFSLVERRLNLTDSAATGGGMQTCLAVGAGGANTPPTANAGGPYSGTAGIPIAFNGSGSSDPDGDTLSYSWNFGDSTPLGTGVTPSHTYATNGTFTVTLTVNDGRGGTHSAGTTATVAVNQAPTANANGPYTGKTGFPIAFSGSGSDPEGQPLTFNWTFGDGGTDTGATPSHTYAAPGNYTVTLTVDDGFQNSAPSNTTANVTNNTPPVALLPASFSTPDPTVTLDGSGSSDPDGDTIVLYKWNFGDGSSQDTTTATVVHTFRAAGTFTVTLVVNDGFVDSAQDTTEVTVLGTPPNVAPVANNDNFNPNQVSGTATQPAPGVLGNDTDGDSGPSPLTAILVSANANLTNLTLNSNGSFTWTPGEKVGTWPFTYQAFDGTDLSNVATVNVTREMSVKKSEYDCGKNQWRVEGKSSAIGGTVTVYIGTTTGGTVVGTATVLADTNWRLQTTGPDPGTASAISADNTATAGGAVLNRTITFKNCP
jgi:PKD repeat protein